MNHQINQKLAAVVFAVLVNALMLGSVSCLFTAPATALSQAEHGAQVTKDRILGVA